MKTKQLLTALGFGITLVSFYCDFFFDFVPVAYFPEPDSYIYFDNYKSALTHYHELTDQGIADRKNFYFFGHAIGLLLIAFGVTVPTGIIRGKIKRATWVIDICIAIALGRMFDEIREFGYLKSANLHSLYALFLIIIFQFSRWITRKGYIQKAWFSLLKGLSNF